MNQSIVIGKRVPLGAAITSAFTAIAVFYPDNAVAITASSIPVTFISQIAWAHFRGITTDPKK